MITSTEIKERLDYAQQRVISELLSQKLEYNLLLVKAQAQIEALTAENAELRHALEIIRSNQQ